MDMSLVYIGVVIVILVAGFVFALRIGMAAALEADHAWPQDAAEAPSATPAAAAVTTPTPASLAVEEVSA